MSACIFLFLFGLQKSSFLCIYSLLREIQLDQNSIFFFKILVLHKNLFKMSCFPWLCWDLNKIIFWWITSVRDHRLTFCTMIPLTFQDTKVIPIILNAVEGRSSAAPSYEAINEGCYSEQKYLDCKEASLRWKGYKRRNVYDQFCRLWLVKQVFLSNTMEEKRNKHVSWISSDPTNFGWWTSVYNIKPPRLILSGLRNCRGF